MQVWIREARPTDIPEMVGICSNTFIEGARHPLVAVGIFRGSFEDHPGWQWVAEMDGRVVGFIACNVNRSEGFANINLIGVDPATKGAGVGGKLLKTLEAHCVQSQLKGVRLGTPYARTFYEKYGYTCTGVDEKYVIELVGRPVPAVEHVSAAPILRTELENVVAWLPEAVQFGFLSQYYHSPMLAFSLMNENGELVAVGVNRVREHENFDVPGGVPGLMTLAFYHVASEEYLDTLLSAAMRVATQYAASRLGVATEEGEPIRAHLLERGFALSAHPAFWTMYRMEKAV